MNSSPAKPIIVFLFVLPYHQPIIKEMYGINFFESRGYRVSSFHLGELLGFQFPSDNCWTKGIKTYAELDRLLESHPSETTVYVDCICSGNDIEPKFEKIYRALRRHRAKFIVVDGARHANSYSYEPVRDALVRLRNAFVQTRKIPSFFFKRIINFLRKYEILYPKPWQAFGLYDEYFKEFIRKLNLPQSSVHSFNSFDYGRYLKFVQDHPALPDPEKTCVFLDCGMTTDPDFAVTGIPSLSPDLYFEEMNKIFEEIEKATGLSVVIAAHPKSPSDNKFHNRLIVRDQTVDLVAKSSLVITHMSTAVGFAVLFKKPVMLIITTEMDSYPLNLWTDRVGKALGITPVRFSQFAGLRDALTHYQEFSLDQYEQYKKIFLRSPFAQEESPWVTVDRVLHQKCARNA